MRTKTTLAAAAILAAGLASSLAQGNVYSLNVVGYVNVAVQGNNKLTLFSNPLLPNGGNYSINNTVVMPDTGADAVIFKWAGTTWDSTTPVYFDTVTKWDTIGDTFTIDAGTAAFIRTAPNAPDTQITFVGEVRQGAASSSTIPANNSVRASMIPVAERQPGTTVGGDDDVILTWDQAAQNWSAINWIYIGGFGWDNGSGDPLTAAGPSLGVGSGFFYQNVAPNVPVTWDRNFTVQ